MDDGCLCRLCMKNSNKFIWIFDEEMKAEISSLLKLCGGIEIFEDPTKSSLMCMICYSKLIEFQKFHEMCVKNEKRWENFGMEDGSSEVSSDVDFGEVFNEVENIKIEEIDTEIPQEVETTENNDPKEQEKENLDANNHRNPSKKTTKRPKIGPLDKYLTKSKKNEMKNEKITNNVQKETHNTTKNVKEPPKIYECDVCHLKFTNFKKMKIHVRSHISRKKELREFYDFKCPTQGCDHRSDTFAEYRSHLTTVHNEKNPGFVCCNKKITDRWYLIDHMIFHLDPDQLRCEICNIVSTNRRILRKHVKNVHFPDKKFECDICGKKFSEFFVIQIHMKIHLSEETRLSLRIHKCEICQKFYETKSVLRIHMELTHLKLKHKCSTCHKKYTSKEELRDHQKNFHGEIGVPVRVQCPTCKGYFTKRSLKSHIRTQHEKVENDNQTVICDICGKEFNRRINLLSHKRRVHTERVFKCSECPKAFPEATRLKEHVAMHTGISLYTCPFCTKKNFNRRVNMYKHFRIMHPKEWEKERSKFKTPQQKKAFSAKYMRNVE